MSIKIPRGLQDITLGKYIKLVQQDLNDEEVISLMCDITIADLRLLPNKLYNQIHNEVYDVLSKVNDEQSLTMTFKLHGVEYGMIPNLEEITYGENKDLTTYLQDWKTMDRAMAVLYRPIEMKNKDLYTIQKYNGSNQSKHLMTDIPLSIVLGAQSFFYNLTEALLFAIPNYLQKVKDSNDKQQTQKASTKQIGEAMTKSIALLRETLEGLKR